jgi:hypothetical protein
MFAIGARGGNVLAISEKTAFGSKSCLGAYAIKRKPAQPVSTPYGLM